VREAGAGLTVPPSDPAALADALMSLRDASLDELADMGLRGRRYVEQRHDLKRLAAQYAQVLYGTSTAAN
jgi:glycosyltransferase involved in cell wall biosynthesis